MRKRHQRAEDRIPVTTGAELYEALIAEFGARREYPTDSGAADSLAGGVADSLAGGALSGSGSSAAAGSDSSASLASAGTGAALAGTAEAGNPGYQSGVSASGSDADAVDIGSAAYPVTGTSATHSVGEGERGGADGVVGNNPEATAYRFRINWKAESEAQELVATYAKVAGLGNLAYFEAPIIESPTESTARAVMEKAGRLLEGDVVISGTDLRLRLTVPMAGLTVGALRTALFHFAAGASAIREEVSAERDSSTLTFGY
ncbi:hypothetical protein [Neoactinobaculum massilliense]|uniref:hypothetical protein n=1 Tax=Neoactinobaculum massilliense TaxID=2364794 RepID=UPI000F529427|nr:hypothetical protein [Neoactinobaculum massilliense]